MTNLSTTRCHGLVTHFLTNNAGATQKTQPRTLELLLLFPLLVVGFFRSVLTSCSCCLSEAPVGALLRRC
ncbi:hypothetical protein ACLKA7_013124 [Drosophila subpalustris]